MRSIPVGNSPPPLLDELLFGVLCELERLPFQSLASADLQTVRRFHEAAFNWVHVAAAELDRRNAFAGMLCTSPKV